MKRKYVQYPTSNIQWYPPSGLFRNEFEEAQYAFPSTYNSFQIQESTISRPPEPIPQPYYQYGQPMMYDQPMPYLGMYAAPGGTPSTQAPFTPYPTLAYTSAVETPLTIPVQQPQQSTGAPPHTPYPVQQKKKQQQQQTGVGTFMNQFKTNDGASYDVNKMMSTAGQMINTVNQFTGMFKTFGSFIK